MKKKLVEMRLGRRELAARSVGDHHENPNPNPNPNSFWNDRGYNVR